MSAPSGGDGGGPRKTPNWALEWHRKKGPGWFGLTRSREHEVRVTLQGLRVIRNGILALGVLVIAYNHQLFTRYDATLQLADKKIPDWDKKSKEK